MPFPTMYSPSSPSEEDTAADVKGIDVGTMVVVKKENSYYSHNNGDIKNSSYVHKKNKGKWAIYVLVKMVKGRREEERDVKYKGQSKNA